MIPPINYLLLFLLMPETALKTELSNNRIRGSTPIAQRGITFSYFLRFTLFGSFLQGRFGA